MSGDGSTGRRIPSRRHFFLAAWSSSPWGSGTSDARSRSLSNTIISNGSVLSVSLRDVGAGRGLGKRSRQLAEKELNAARHQPIDFGLTSARRHEMAARLALVKRDAVHVDLFAPQGRGVRQHHRIRRDPSDQGGARADGTARGRGRRRRAWHRGLAHTDCAGVASRREARCAIRSRAPRPRGRLDSSRASTPSGSPPGRRRGAATW